VRRRHRSRLLIAAGLVAVGWLLVQSGDAPENSGSRFGCGGDALEAADVPKSKASGSRSAGQQSAEREAFEVAREREGRRPGSVVDQIRWRNAPEPGGAAGRDPSGELRFHEVEQIALDPLSVPEGALTVRLSGQDPLAPRALVAWRVKKSRQSVLARGFSDEDGAIYFPQVLVPRDGLEVVVSDASSAPGVPGSSLAQRLPGRLPRAPHASLIDFDNGTYWLRIVPSEATGNLLLADINGAVFASYSIPSTPDRAARIFEVGVTSPAPHILLGHEFSDGRASDWQVVALDLPDVAAAAAN
jgi:hypothetical protein